MPESAAAVRVGLLGLGCVGCGVVRALARNRGEIERRAGRRLQVVAACARDLERRRDCDLEGIALTADPQALVDRPDVDVVVELFGGLEPARALALRAIGLGKPVVTANKHLIAVHGNELFARAEAAGVGVAFEAAVAGSVPIVKALRESLSGNRIEWVAGIINGTCNYVLTAMERDGRPFAEVLAEAQRRGYAEADPRFDIDGTDAAHKLAILASLAFGFPLSFERVHVEGIDGITPENLADAALLGYRVKHLGIARRRPEGVELRAHPALVPRARLLANVDGVMNAVAVKADAAGAQLYYGAGAGAEPTASAVVADLIDAARTRAADAAHRAPHLAFAPQALDREPPLLPMARAETACYLRMRALDRPGVLAAVTRILGELEISIEAIEQKEPAAPEPAAGVPVVLLTHAVPEERVDRAIARIEELAEIVAPVQRIRIETLQ